MDNDRKAGVYALFDALGIEYNVVEYPPMFTQADNEIHKVNIGAVIFKNLFLRNADKSRYYLFSLPLTKRTDLVSVREILGESRLSFGDEDALLEKLNILPGSVSFLFLIDKEICDSERFGVHPNDNTATIIFAPREIPRILGHFGAKYLFV